jgi:hypothetical protein
MVCSFTKRIVVLVAFLLGATAASSCTKAQYWGYNTAFVQIYNTQDGIESPGDTWTWHANVTAKSTEEGGESEYNSDLLVGELVGYCIHTPNGYWECDETIIMDEKGSIYVHYVQTPPATESTGGIIGGTDEYKQAAGQITFTAPSTDDEPWGIGMELCMPSSSSSSSSRIHGSRLAASLLLFGMFLARV